MPRLTRALKSVRELAKVNSLPKGLSEFVHKYYNILVNDLNAILGNLSFNQNFTCEIFDISVDAGQTIKVNHKFKTVPNYRIILKNDSSSGDSYLLDGVWTENYVEFINNGASQMDVTIGLFKE